MQWWLRQSGSNGHIQLNLPAAVHSSPGRRDDLRSVEFSTHGVSCTAILSREAWSVHDVGVAQLVRRVAAVTMSSSISWGCRDASVYMARSREGVSSSHSLVKNSEDGMSVPKVAAGGCSCCWARGRCLPEPEPVILKKERKEIWKKLNIVLIIQLSKVFLTYDTKPNSTKYVYCCCGNENILLITVIRWSWRIFWKTIPHC